MNDPTIIASIIGAIATLVAAIISPYISRILEYRKLSKISPQFNLDRKKVLLGTWEGSYIQETGKPESIGERPLELILKEEKGLIVGDVRIADRNPKLKYEAHLINVIFDGTLFKFDYVNKNSNTTHFGTMFGKISGNGEYIEGLFVGYGLLSEMFVRGNIYLEKRRV